MSSSGSGGEAVGGSATMSAAHDAASELASTIQSAHINPSPSAVHDANPSTSASRKAPVHIHSPHSHGHTTHTHNSTSTYTYSFTHAGDEDGEDEDESSEFPISLLEVEPVARKPNLPPLPDLRFEQSYLARIKPLQDQGQWVRVALVTLQDQVLLPLTQGIVWNLAIFGWRFWNAGTAFKGQSVGARVRRWWWGVNNWDLPPARPRQKEL